jgi:hypothetical protein
MAIDLTGIINENEFYTHHYLSAILENDLKDLFKRWEAEKTASDVRPPYEQLKSLAREYFRLKEQQLKTRLLEEKHQAEAEFIARLLGALGYTVNSATRQLDDGGLLPIAGEVAKQSGAPELWIIHGFNPNSDDLDPLESTISDCHYGFQTSEENDDKKDKRLSDCVFEEIISRQVFGLAEPPRWVILCNLDQILLLDRSKWNQKRFLRFDLNEIFGRREHSTFKAVAALLHRESVCPEDGLSLLDSLDENSHKHAFAVSEDLKYALRQSIELLGNEAVYYLREVLKEKIYGRELAEKLTIECLRYMYRLLFMFYIEARPELGYAPMDSEQYRKGYSLEGLRELELVPITTEESRNGTYIHESLQLLFDMIYKGYPSQGKDTQLSIEGTPGFHIFRIPALNSHLFDPSRTALLNRVKFRNFVLQEVIRLMSLTRPAGRRERRGRISYAQLGINQLGAVYEALLSYRGFFAETDLYEVKKAGDNFDELSIGYFVKAEDLEKYVDDEKFDENGKLVSHPRGKFIYRLAGRDREKSASYYTPEVLTRCLVKYALKELLKDKTADEILHLTVCEPAMGSAAFLNEAVNQLAEAYLQRKQKELGRDIPHDQYLQEKQKVKMFMADNNVFGVDLNPVAVELAEVSLWLNTIYKGGFVPWFGLQLACGNSLIGARRQVFDSSLLRKANRDDPLWLDEVPVRIPLGENRPKSCVYHFLLPDQGMANYKDKVIKSLADEEIKTINAWRKEFAKPYRKSDITQLEKLSRAVDRLWESHVNDLKSVRKRTSDPLKVFGQLMPNDGASQTITKYKDRVFSQELMSQNVRNSSAYRRLKLVMDYWCALWFWPIEKADFLPTREEFLFEVSLLLEGDVYSSEPAIGEQLSMFPDTRPKQLSLDMVERLGVVCVDDLCEKFERLRMIQGLARKYRFLHWELEFADLFKEKGGFDLVLGNPPWIKVEWKEGGVLGDAEPLFVLRKFSAAKLNTLRAETLERLDFKGAYLSAFEDADGTQNFLNGYQNYPLLKGIQTNLYKCFLPQAWMVGKQFVRKSGGISAFLHMEGVYDDPHGGKFREEIYCRLKAHFQFQNEMKFFPIGNRKKYSINIYSNIKTNCFDSINNLFHPSTIDASYIHTGAGICDGIKTKNNRWNIAGHSDRIITVCEEELELFCQLYDSDGSPPAQAKLPAIHSCNILKVLKKFARQPRTLIDYSDKYCPTVMWDETNAEKRDNTIKRNTVFPEATWQWIISGPHFFLSNPFFQTPKKVCNSHRAYDVLDLSAIPDDYLPRTNYTPNLDFKTYRRKCPKVAWGDKSPVINFYRVNTSRVLDPAGERTLQGSILPPMVGHLDSVFSIAFADIRMVSYLAACWMSLPYDFFIRITGKSSLRNDLAKHIPVQYEDNAFTPFLLCRALMLACLTNHYVELWSECWDSCYRYDRWTKCDSRLPNKHFEDLTKKWNRIYSLRNDYIRRQAIIEIDVLVSMSLGLTITELINIYRLQFPVLHQYETDTWYDRNGKIVFTINRNLANVGFARPKWNSIKHMKSGTVERTITDDTQPGGPRERTIIYQAPFDRCDREKDYETAWAEFEKRF